VHESYIQEWAERQDPSLSFASITQALARIAEIKSQYPDDILLVEEQVSGGLKIYRIELALGMKQFCWARGLVIVLKLREMFLRPQELGLS